MMNEKELSDFKTPCQYIAGVLQPCVVVKSHLEALKEIKRLGKVIDNMDREIYLIRQAVNPSKER